MTGVILGPAEREIILSPQATLAVEKPASETPLPIWPGSQSRPPSTGKPFTPPTRGPAAIIRTLVLCQQAWLDLSADAVNVPQKQSRSDVLALRRRRGGRSKWWK